jgi:hypothetical protein
MRGAIRRLELHDHGDGHFNSSPFMGARFFFAASRARSSLRPCAFTARSHRYL